MSERHNSCMAKADVFWGARSHPAWWLFFLETVGIIEFSWKLHPPRTPLTYNADYRIHFADVSITGWWQLKYFLFLPLPWGRWTQFDEYFWDGWFNHQLDQICRKFPNVIFWSVERKSRTPSKPPRNSSSWRGTLPNASLPAVPKKPKAATEMEHPDPPTYGLFQPPPAHPLINWGFSSWGGRGFRLNRSISRVWIPVIFNHDISPYPLYPTSHCILSRSMFLRAGTLLRHNGGMLEQSSGQWSFVANHLGKLPWTMISLTSEDNVFVSLSHSQQSIYS